jgi:ABC-type transport system involved in multi-copper enzyme maturation permease subunit
VIDVVLVTLRELVRRRFVLAAIVATALLVALTAWGFHSLTHAHDRHGATLSPLEVRTTSAGLVLLIAYMFSFVLAVAATFVAAPALANEIESGVLLPIVVRPIARASILLGKTIGIGLMLGAYLLVAGIAELTIVRAITGYAPPHPFEAFGFVWLLALVMVAFATLLGTRLSAIASSIVAVVLFGIAWIGGIVGGIGGAVHNQALVNAGTISQLVLPSDAMWQAAAYRLEPVAMIVGMQQAAAHNSYGGPFLIAAPPPLPMLLWTLAWIVVVVSLASWSFARRSL